jgi:spore germination cell wall hydrolase CwlJ-like protein
MESTTKSLSYFIGFIFVAVLVKMVTVYKFNDFGNRANMPDDIKTVAQMKKDLECMTLNIYREAAYEPIEGRIAVAQVTMNRVAHPDFPNDVCGVVYQKSVVYSRVVCQFSWYCDATHRARPINQKAYDESYEVAKKVLLENFRLPSLEHALYYHADYVNPRWRLEKIDKIGTHIFYKPHGKDHDKLAGI